MDLELKNVIYLDESLKVSDADLLTFNCWIDGPDSDSEGDDEEDEDEEVDEENGAGED